MSETLNPEQYTKYEKARILGARALQISANAPILIKIPKEELDRINYDAIKIAELEFSSGILPITVKRPLPKRSEKKKEDYVEIVKEEKPKVEKKVDEDEAPEEALAKDEEKIKAADKEIEAEVEAEAELEVSAEEIESESDTVED
jgi:DNA-directed RNA polymerase subunit K/omega